MRSFFSALRERYMFAVSPLRQHLVLTITGVLVVVLAAALLERHLSRLSRVRDSRSQTLQELLLLRRQHQLAAAAAQQLAGRVAAVAPGETPASLIEQSGLVAAGSMRSTPLPPREHGSLLAEGAEVTITGLTLNDTVNLLYRLEYGQKPLLIKKGGLRSRYNDPARLDLTIQIYLLRPVGTQTRQ